MDKKRVYIRYLIGSREFTHHAEIRYFAGPFMTSYEAQTKNVSSVEQIRSLEEVRDTVSGPTQLFQLNVVPDVIRIITFH